MKLRKLELKDAPLMLEWMHNKDVVEHLSANFAEKTITDCENFIAACNTDETNLHLAVADDNDEYMGTVSLKHIDKTLGFAEFAITVRECAMGKDFSKFGMKEILELGIKSIGLKSIYWCVSLHNARAVRFYDKCGYIRTEGVPKEIKDLYADMTDMLWYVYEG